jgi:ubiquinone biosynthesis protein COQ4
METEYFRPLEALRGVRGIIADPTKTEEAFRIIRAIDAGGIDRLHARFRESPKGRALLEDRPALLSLLEDRDTLEAMPEGSLGRAYLEFCDAEGITPGGLVEASHFDEVDEEVDEELRYVADRMRDSHDLWHVVVGCRTDLAGELAILAFTTAQTESIGVGVLTLAGYARSFTLPKELGGEGRRLVKAAWHRARNAAFLPVADWESLLAKPLSEVRAELNVEPVPAYSPYYVEDLAAA